MFMIGQKFEVYQQGFENIMVWMKHKSEILH